MKTYTRKNSNYLKKIFSASNFDEICRLCLSEDVNNLLPLFGEEGNRYNERIKFALDIMVQEGDRLPSNICENCHILLEQTYLFKKKCSASEEKLKEHFRIVDVEEEQKINYSLRMSFLEVDVMEENTPRPKASSLLRTSIKNEGPDPFTRDCKTEPECDEEPEAEAISEEVCTPTSTTDETSTRKTPGLSEEICRLWEKEDEDEEDEESEEVVLLDISRRESEGEDLMEVEVEVQDNQLVVKEVTKTYGGVSPAVVHSPVYTTTLSEVLGYENKCFVCKKVFTSKNSVDRHMLVHSGERPYRCDICEKSFNQSTILKRHMFLHQKEKPFKCSICEKSYTQRENLTHHMSVHGFKKHTRYKCRICDKQFMHSSGLSRHLSFHKGKRFTCTMCKCSYSDSSTLARHLKQRHGDEGKSSDDAPGAGRN